ncbi:type 1 glutamine amidotransferase [Nesterenkonia lutea]|uniref:Lipid II isoglutaminyl synthase (glutamine-hydrolyzing) subunit GatD n=1 Tax=Nesterenkonia lutea TaxID=272919 RepID=A0ABR9JGX9_9MICC|nr:glutamine amidotransferase [Nesterenkonia lutea]MBE1525194.1 CobQ-like glutamine amidotransferase family enzyme [Nesterenkonia lutea]
MASGEAKPIHVLQLYPRDMNIYGDFGNALVLSRRLQWRGYEPILHSYDPEDEFPEQVDLVIGGGGQDSGQDKIQQDLLRLGDRLHALAEADTPMLMICGLYQLFGHSFLTREGREIQGVGILDLRTEGTDTRLIGNVVAESKEFGEILGYENHSGQTYLGPGVEPLARVTKGEGNNARDAHEGARHRNIVGSYLHGSLLPKNPAIADFLIAAAVANRYGEQIQPSIEPAGSAQPIDELTRLARSTATKRPR